MSTDSAKKKPALSPLAPPHMPHLMPVPGVDVGAVAAGLRYKGRVDLMVAHFPDGAQVAGVFTRSKTPGAPVDWTRQALTDSNGNAKALVVNAGNANAFTGSKGSKATQAIAAAMAKLINCKPSEILQASTGVIGEPLQTAPIIKYLKRMVHGLSANLWSDAAKAILTTDTFPKGSSKLTSIHGVPTTITGIAKGSGMIEPDMATMLGFIFTNANISADCLQSLLAQHTETTFNAITVDSDTSTSDMVLAFATGCSGCSGRSGRSGRGASYDTITDPDDPALDDFKARLHAVMQDLAHQVVKDGEGATKFVEITIDGADSATAAKTIAKSVANSPLVKTAIAGEDPNWGRLIMAAGKSGEKVDRDNLRLWIGDQLVAHNGMVHNRYKESDAATHMRGQNIHLKMDMGVGDHSATVWTCDFTKQYISINADYRS